MTPEQIQQLADEAGIVVTGEAVIKLCQLVAAKERERMATTWQPIETAPRDGTRVLVYTDHLQTVASYDMVFKKWELALCGEFAASGQIWPTHWMPLTAGAHMQPTKKD